MIDPIVRLLTGLALGALDLSLSQLGVVAALMAHLPVYGPATCKTWCLELFSSLPLNSKEKRARSLTLCVFYIRACNLYIGPFKQAATVQSDGDIVLLAPNAEDMQEEPQFRVSFFPFNKFLIRSLHTRQHEPRGRLRRALRS